MKFVFVLAALVCGAATASAQEAATAGVKAGVNFANLSFDDEPDRETSHRTGLAAGLFASIPVNSRIAFQPELLYVMKGATLDVEGREGALKIDYVEVPLLADVRLHTGTARVSLLAGPSFGFRSRARLEQGGESEDASEGVERVDVGLVTGLAVTAGRFVVDGRYTWGLTNIAKDEVEVAKNRVLSITVGWRFR